ncbi:MAG: isoquinoline 1-oxidoreductase alpha subunit [Polyangiales bacterium]|jgi:isoquinoline 1-oxidoreductase alpha subunit
MRISLTLNGQARSIETDGEQPLLWVLRDELELKGTKFGCGKAACGACTIHVDGDAVRSCSFAAKHADGKAVVTIEGLGTREAPHPTQQAWLEEIVPQCGYCQPGFIMAAAALIESNPNPTDDDIDASIANICRCGTHVRIRRAIKRAAAIKRGE